MTKTRSSELTPLGFNEKTILINDLVQGFKDVDEKDLPIIVEFLNNTSIGSLVHVWGVVNGLQKVAPSDRNEVIKGTQTARWVQQRKTT